MTDEREAKEPGSRSPSEELLQLERRTCALEPSAPEHEPAVDPASAAPHCITAGWSALGDPRHIVACREVSAKVSTNRVYELGLSDGHAVIAKLSSYGSYVHFRQDHQLVHEWSELLHGRWSGFLAKVLTKNGRAFTFREGRAWVAFYQKVPFYDFLPRVLTPQQVISMGSEMAHFHRASHHCAANLTPSWKSLGADIGVLHAMAGRPDWLEQRGLPPHAEGILREHCETLLEEAERLGYHQMTRIPLLVDWNTGNFSVGLEEDGFKMYSRWDYDWFRMEPRTLDLYFCARVVRADGDQTEFSYVADPLFEPRFESFLRAYHKVFHLQPEDILFLKEAYRFFILNDVIYHGEHFFRPALARRLQREVLEKYLPALKNLHFDGLVQAVKNS